MVELEHLVKGPQMKKFGVRLLVAILTAALGVVVSFVCHRLITKEIGSIPEKVEQRPVSPGHPTKPQRLIPSDWYRVDGNGFTFYLPKSIKLKSGQRSQEALWGSVFSNNRVQIDAEYTLMLQTWSETHLEKQIDYQKVLGDVDGHEMRIRTWCWAKPASNFKCEAEFVQKVSPDRSIKLEGLAKERQDLELVQQIFRTVALP